MRRVEDIRQGEKIGRSKEKERWVQNRCCKDAGRDMKFLDMKEEKMVNRHRETVVTHQQC